MLRVASTSSRRSAISEAIRHALGESAPRLVVAAFHEGHLAQVGENVGLQGQGADILGLFESLFPAFAGFAQRAALVGNDGQVVERRGDPGAIAGLAAQVEGLAVAVERLVEKAPVLLNVAQRG